MNRFIAQVLQKQGLPSDAAAVNARRQQYWKSYGATLLGMMLHHDVRPADFLREAHRFDDLGTMIRAEKGLQHLLEHLPGRKILLTNAPQTYARQVLKHIGLHRHFMKHIAIESMHIHGRLRPKPSRVLLRNILAREHTPAHRCILVEDTIINLKAAKQLGLRTVWVTQYMGSDTLSPMINIQRKTMCPAYVDVKVRSVLQLSDHLSRLMLR